MFKKKQTATDPSDNCLPCKEDSCSTITTTEQVYDNSLAERLTELEENFDFLGLNDTPDSYEGFAGKVVTVNDTEDGLVFTDKLGNTIAWGDLQGNIEDQLDLLTLLNSKADKTDGLISGGNIDISDFPNGNITVAPAKWLITTGGVQSEYEALTSTLFSGIGLSSTGNQRYVAFFGDSSSNIIKVEGIESPAAVMPSTPVNTIPIGHVLITDSVAQPPVVDLTGYAKLNEVNYFTKNQNILGQINPYRYSLGLNHAMPNNGSTTYLGNGSNILFLNPNTGSATVSQLLGVSFSAAGTFVVLSNRSTANVIIKHNTVAQPEGNRIVCPNDEDYTLEPTESIFIVKTPESGFSYFICGSSKYKIGGDSSFSTITGSPDDNPALAAKFAQIDNDKLDKADYNQHFKGRFLSLAALEAATFTPPLQAGDYAQVDEGVDNPVRNYNWDVDDEEWVEGGSGSAATNTDQLPEGSTNLYFTTARVKTIVDEEKKNYIKEIYVLSVMRVFFPMDTAGEVSNIEGDTSMGSIQYRVGETGAFVNFTGAFTYNAGDKIYVQWSYISPVTQEGFIRLTGKDN